MKILIVYYSKTGMTKEIARTLGDELTRRHEVKIRRIRMKKESNLLATYFLDAQKAIRRQKPEIEVVAEAGDGE